MMIRRHLLNMEIKLLITAVLLLVALSGCNPAQLPATEAVVESPPTPPASTPVETSTASPAPTQTSTPTIPPTASPTTTATFTPEATATASPSATQTVTPTAALPMVIVQEQANCRYGPGQAYLYSHGLYAGDRGDIHGRNASGTWLWIKPENLERRCWAAASVLEIHGDAMEAPVVQTTLPQSTLYGPPEEVLAVRSGPIVHIAWSTVPMTEDDYRGYLIEASVCQNGRRTATAVHVNGLSYDIIDDGSCEGESWGRLYAVEKHGYTTPVMIDWPQ